MRNKQCKKWIVIMVIAAVIPAVTVSGCSKKEAQTAAVTDDPNQSGEIVFWGWSESETMGLAARFNEVYPNIKIKFVPVDSANYLMKFQTAIMSGSELPDVGLQEVNSRGALFALDCWENLEKAPYNFDRNIVFPQLIPIMVNSNDELLGIERELNPSGLIYKRPLALQYLGADDPDAVAAMISDWDKFIEIGGKIAVKSGGKIKMLPGMGDMSSILLEQYTERIFDGNRVYASKFFTRNFDIMIRANKAGILGRLTPYSPSWNSSYLDDEHIFYFAAPWTARWILKPNDPDSLGRWGMVTAPVRGFSLGGTSYGIPANAKNKAQAWKFIEWATTTDSGIAACQEVVGAIVSRQATYAGGYQAKPDPYFAGQDSNAYLIEKAAPAMKIRPMNQYDVVLADVTTFMVNMLQNNPNADLENTVQQALAELKNKLPPAFTIE